MLVYMIYVPNDEHIQLVFLSDRTFEKTFEKEMYVGLSMTCWIALHVSVYTDLIKMLLAEKEGN